MKLIGIVDIVCSVGSFKIKLIKLMDFCLGGCIAFVLPNLRKKVFLFSPESSLLIIRPGGIGDAVFLLPILKQLKLQYPLLKMDILCEKRNAQVFLSQASLEKNVYCYDNLHQFIQLLSHRYDYVVDTEQWHYLSILIGNLLKKKTLIGFSTRPLRKKLLDISVDYDLDGYELNNFMRLFEPLGLQKEPLSIRGSFVVSESLCRWAIEQLVDDYKYVVLFIGGSIKERRLTMVQLELMMENLQKKGFKIILLGGADVGGLAQELTRERVAVAQGVLNYVGKLSLGQSAALIQQCKLFIGTDSGLLHIASAVGTPVIGFFGPGNVSKWASKQEGDQVISKYLSCAPCTFFGYTVPTCQGRFDCMKEIHLIPWK